MASAPDSRRLAFIDNIRWSMIILVLSMHASDTYSPFGNWYYTEHPPVTFATTLFFAFYQSFLQAFFMALLFFTAAYFSVTSYDRKGAARFSRERFVRLGVPTLLYMFCIGPLTQYFLSRTWGGGGFFYQWITHIRDGQILSETGPMWFAAVLLLFSWIYAAARALVSRPVAEGRRIPLQAVVPFTLAMALAIFTTRIWFPENISILNVHVGDLPQYVFMFCAGLCAARGAWLQNLPAREGTAWAIAFVGLAIPLFVALLIYGGAMDGDTSRYAGGANWVSFFKCVWESLVCVGMTFGLVVLYRAQFDRQGALAKKLSASAFAVYLFHPPILIALALALRSFDAPAIIKAATLTLCTAVAAFMISDLVLRRIPGLKKIL